ncbi:MAG: tetratricopeptide repeat protein [Sphingopyxis sp.]|nr:tetratricopeptide repeat protein [Sphingopyxis sp.]
MPGDQFGNAISGADGADVQAVDAFVGGLLAYHVRAADILARAADPRSAALVQIYAGYLHLLGEHVAAANAARPFLDRAAQHDALTWREDALLRILRDWIGADIDAVIAGLTEVLERHPSDLLALKLLHYHLFNRGAFPEMLRATEGVADASPDAPYIHGMRAFALEQLHLLGEAEQAAWRALEIIPDDPWAQHALAHVWLTEGRIEEGAAALEHWASGWAELNSFMVTHLWWHLALFRLSQGRENEALQIYDAQVWAHDKSYSQDQVNAVSLLARLDLAGTDVGDRWNELADHLAGRERDTLQPFLTVQYLYGLARARRPQADILLDAIDRTAADGASQDHDVWDRAARPLAHGLVAHARGDFESAVSSISRALPHLIGLGGSHAQRDLFDLILLDAQIGSGRWLEAQQALELRRHHDPDGVPLNRALGEIYERLDLPGQAAEARARVARRLA